MVWCRRYWRVEQGIICTQVMALTSTMATCTPMHCWATRGTGYDQTLHHGIDIVPKHAHRIKAKSACGHTMAHNLFGATDSVADQLANVPLKKRLHLSSGVETTSLAQNRSNRKLYGSVRPDSNSNNGITAIMRLAHGLAKAVRVSLLKYQTIPPSW